MFGGLRFFLALLVVLSHLQIPTPLGLNVGVMAVVVFYILAGYVVSYLLSNIFVGTQGVKRFYYDRLWRIFPQYLLALTFATVVWWLLSPKSTFLSQTPNGLDWLANIFVVPLNFYMFTGQDSFTLLPPTWSLGAEIQFYLLAPFLLLYAILRNILLIISIIVFFLAQLGYIDTDIYGYRLLIGVLFIFYLGAIIHQRQHRLLIAIAALFILYGVALLQMNVLANFVREVAIGIAAGVILVSLLAAKQTRFLWIQWFDKRLGNLSYGVFLFHFPVIWFMQWAGVADWLLNTVLVVLVSSLLAYSGFYWFERPVWQRFRRDYRG